MERSGAVTSAFWPIASHDVTRLHITFSFPSKNLNKRLLILSYKPLYNLCLLVLAQRISYQAAITIAVFIAESVLFVRSPVQYSTNWTLKQYKIALKFSGNRNWTVLPFKPLELNHTS